jgi:hypothetical protein
MTGANRRSIMRQISTKNAKARCLVVGFAGKG